MLYLKTTWFGVFLYNEKIIESKLFPKDSNEIASRISSIMSGDIIPEELSFKSYNPVVAEYRQKLVGVYDNFNDIEILPEDYGYSTALLQESCIHLTNEKIKNEQSDRTKRISEAIYALEDIIKIINTLYERIRTWNDYLTLSVNLKDEELINNITTISTKSENLDKAEEESLKNVVQCLEQCIKLKSKLDSYINLSMKEISPNISGIVGTNIAARLIAKAGGLKELAILPSSTIQVLGAEQALFRHLKDGTPSPKHGLLFQHELINTSPKKYRGRLARLLATKISIAAKADAFTNNSIFKELNEEIENRFREITGKNIKYHNNNK